MLRLKFSQLVRKWTKSPLFWAAIILLTGLLARLAREMRVVQSTPVLSWEKETSADCAVVLTGGPGRVREGLDLLADHRVKKLIISGVHPDARLRDLLGTWTFYGGLREEDIVLEKRSETTYGNAQQSLPIVEALRCRDILLITSRVHMHRAFRTFRAAYPESIEIQMQPVLGNRFEPSLGETLVEACKSLFYSVWAY